MNLRGWWSLPTAVQVAYTQQQQRERAVRERTLSRLEQLPGEALDRDGVDEPPSTIRDDEISRAATRLLSIHG